MNRLQDPLGIASLCAGIALILAVSIFAQQKDGQMRITDTRIDIRPGTKISESDQKALNEVLKKYGESVYKIETLTDGKMTGQPQGKLEDKYIDATLAAEVKQAKAAGASVQMEQIVDIHHAGEAKPPPAGGIQVQEAKELINALKPILEKYSKK